MRRVGGGFRFRGLAVQIVLWTVLPLTLVLIGVAFTGVYSHERAMRALVDERDRALAAVSASQIREVFLQRASRLDRVAGQPAIVAGDLAAQRALLASVGDLNGQFAGNLALLSDGGELVAAGGDPPDWLRFQASVAALAHAVTARQNIALGPVLDILAGREIVLLGVPVYDPTGAMAAVLAGPIAVQDLGLSGILSQAQVDAHWTLYLVDETGRVLAHSPSTHARTSFAGHTGLETVQEDSQPGAVESQSPEGEHTSLAYAPLGLGAEWRVIIEQPWHDVSSPVLRYSQAMPLVATLAAVVAVLTLYYGIRSLARPLRALKRQAEQVAWGDFGATSTPVGGVDEIEDLRRSLDQMARRIQGYQRGMHDYIAAITQGQEEERRRLARELHDDTAQTLIALGQQVEMAQKMLAAHPERTAERLTTVRTMIAQALEGVRRFSRDLRPIYLEDLGFLPALRALAAEAGERHGLAIELTTKGAVRRLSPDLELTIFRIVQEALNNVVQHARAGHAWVEVCFEAVSLALTVRDDGQGFVPPDQPDLLARDGHFGLMGIQERALLYGGKLTLHSARGKGTELMVQLAYPSESSPPHASGPQAPELRA